MKKSYKVAIAAVAAVIGLASQGAYAQSAGDLLLGINNNDSGGTADLVVDLGTFANLNAHQNTAFSLGVNNTTLASDLGGTGGPASYNVGIVGAKSVPTGTSSLFVSVKDNGTGTASAQGSTTPPSLSQANYGSALGNVFPAVVTGNNTTFTVNIAKDPTTVGTGDSSFSANTGINPLANVGGNSVVLDLYREQSAGTPGSWSYLGDILVNFSTDTYTFDPVAAPVPEPATYGVIAGAGLLMLALRRQFVRKNA